MAGRGKAVHVGQQAQTRILCLVCHGQRLTRKYARRIWI
jgi:hypothetical protein